MNLLPVFGLFLTYRPLLLERNYAGGGEAIWLLLQGVFWLAGMAVVVIVLAKLNSRAEEAYQDGYHKFLKRVGLVAALFVVVYTLASIGGR